MRRAGLLALAILVSLPAASEGARRSPCKPKGAKTMVVTRDARIFSVSRLRGEDRTDVVYGCLFRGGKRRELSRVVDDGYYATGAAVREARLLGRRVAFVTVDVDTARSKYDGSSGGDQLAVVDLRTGRRIREVQLSDNSSVTDWEATRGGAVAWIQRVNGRFGVGGDPALSVFKHDSGGQALLESSAGIPPDSLALGGSTLYWTSAGQARSAQLR